MKLANILDWERENRRLFHKILTRKLLLLNEFKTNPNLNLISKTPKAHAINVGFCLTLFPCLTLHLRQRFSVNFLIPDKITD